MDTSQRANFDAVLGPTEFFPARSIETVRQPISGNRRETLPIALLGVPFDNLAMGGTVRRIEQMVASRQPHFVVTANVDFLVQARRDVELHRILLDAHLVLCDGTPLVWASRLLGNPLPERVAGSDLAPRLIEAGARNNYRFFFLGASPEANEQAVARLMEQYPALNIAGHYAPPFKPLLEMDHEEIKRRVRAARPDVLFVAFGCPKQEKWIAMHYRSLGVPVTIGVGATIDFLAGRMKRAPRWMQRTGTEWIFRMLQEPRRLFKRYVTDLRCFGSTLLAQCWQMQWRRGRGHFGTPAVPLVVEPGWQRIQASERLDAESIRRDTRVWEEVSTGGRHCLLELANVKFIDSTGVALLVRLQKRILAHGRHLILLAPAAVVRRALALMQLEDLFEIGSDAVEARELIGVRDRERAMQVTHGARRPLVWQGEITSANAEEVWQQTRAEINSMSSWRKQWIIDLSQVRFIDSSGLGVMIRAKKYAPRRGAEVRFAGASPTVRNVLRLSHLESFLLHDAA
jgi:N-acetylglucosaminyldiphosphoundecaprenol N-acetyl-beta-D-mannosaminyltransferase